MGLRIVDADGVPEDVALADVVAQLEFVVESLAGTELRHVGVWRLGLTLRPLERRIADHQRAGAAVIADRDPFVVGHEWVVRTEQLADGVGVVDAGVEVGVVADVAWQREFAGGLRHQRLGPIALRGAADAESLGDFVAQVLALDDVRGHEPVHVVGADQAGCAQVEHLVTDGHTDAKRRMATGRTITTERQVLNRKVRALDVG